MKRAKLSLFWVVVASLGNAAPIDLSPPGIFESHLYNLSAPVSLPKAGEEKAGGIADGPVRITTVGEHYSLEVTKASVEDDLLKMDVKLTIRIDKMQADSDDEKNRFVETNPEIYFISKESVKLPLPESINLKLLRGDQGPVLTDSEDAIPRQMLSVITPYLAPEAMDKWLEISSKLEKAEHKAKVDEWISKVKPTIYQTIQTKFVELLKMPEAKAAILAGMTGNLPKLALWGDSTMSLVYERLRVGPPDPRLQKVVWHLRPERYESPASGELTKLWREFEPKRNPPVEGVKPANRVKFGIGGEAMTYLMQNYLKSFSQPPVAGISQVLPEGLGTFEAEKLLIFTASPNETPKDLLKFLAQYRSDKIDLTHKYVIGLPTDGTRVVRFLPWKSIRRVSRTTNEGQVVDNVKTSYLDIAVKLTVRSMETPKTPDEVIDLLLMFAVTPHKTLKLQWIAPIDPKDPKPAADPNNELTVKAVAILEKSIKPLVTRSFSTQGEGDPMLFAIQSTGEPKPRPGTNDATHPALEGETANWVEALEFNYNP